jgi:hypothetical protein
LASLLVRRLAVLLLHDGVVLLGQEGVRANELGRRRRLRHGRAAEVLAAPLLLLPLEELGHLLSF